MEKIAKYSIMKELGRGSHGVVYHALDVESQRQVALKVIRVSPELADDDPELLRLVHTFEEQAKKLSEIEHRNVAQVFEAGYVDGAIYIALELIDGKTLKWFMEDTGRVKIEEAVEIIKDLSKGIKAIHKLGIVLGDFKPSDVVIRPGIPVIVGFGLPAGYDTEGIVKVTKLVESVIYTAPEVVEGSPPTGRSDIYTLGLILYAMLAGGNPFEASTVANALINVRVKDFPAVEKANPKVPLWLAKVVSRSISRDPEGRYATVDEMLDDLTLRSILKEAEEVRTVDKGEEAEAALLEPGLMLKKRKRMEYIEAAVVVLSFVIIIWLLVYWMSPVRYEQQAERDWLAHLQQLSKAASTEMRQNPEKFDLVKFIGNYYRGGLGQAMEDYSLWRNENIDYPTGLDVFNEKPRRTFTIIAYPREKYNPKELKTFAIREDQKIREWDDDYGGDFNDITTWKVVLEP